MSKFQLFLEQSNFKADLKSAVLKNVIVDDITKGWHFFIEFEDAPSPSSYDDFLDKIKLYFSISGIVDEIKVTFKVHSTTWQENAIIYYKWILNKLIEKRSSCSIFNNFKIEYDDGFILYVDKAHNRYKRITKWLGDEFKYYGLETTFRFEIDPTIPTAEAALTQRRAKAQTEISYIPKPKIEKTEPISISNFKRNFKGDKVSPIKDIPKTNYELDKLLNTKSDASFTIEGEIIETEVRKFTRVQLLTMIISDKDDSITVKQFLNNDKAVASAEAFQPGFIVRCSGRAQFDTFIKDVVLMANRVDSIATVQSKERKDKEKTKRVEFHVHTKMSNLDGVTSASDYIDQAIKWGHKAIAFTDHDGLYAYPEIYKASKGKDIKPIYGVELSYFDETQFKMAFHEQDIDLRKATYVVFDLETTGLSSTRDKIIEISAVKIENLQIIDRFNVFVNPEEKLSAFTTELTTITDADLENAETIEKVLPQFLEFIGSAILVAHNAAFDLSHLYQKMIDIGLPLVKYPSIDTIALARYYYEDLKRFNLKAVARHFKVRLEQHHRAEADAQATAEIFLKMLGDLFEKGIYNHQDINKDIDLKTAYKCGFPNHVTILAQNQAGYKNLFKLVSETLTEYFHNGPKLTKTTLEKYRQGLLVGSSCYKGEVFEAALYKSDQELIDAMAMFDYIEVQPPVAYEHLAKDLGKDFKFIIESTIRKIILTAEKLDKLVIASGDVHYLNKEDQIYRDIYINAKLVGGGLHDLASYDKAPQVHFMTTDEMLKQFQFLGDAAYQIVVTNTNILNQKIDKIEGFPSTLYSLSDDAFHEKLGLPSIKEKVTHIVYQNAHHWYGEKLHPMVLERIEIELNNIIENEFAPIYYISYLLVQKSLEEGYLVGSRGSVGSSFVATLMEITEVNPLKPHYRCKNGDFTVFKFSDEDIKKYGITPNEQAFQPLFDGISSGYDLIDQNCPICGEKLHKDGQDIPFETFLGFSGDKIPDIDLNFSGDYQAKAHSYVRELLGEDHAYRAGTIQTVAERNAFGYVKGYLEEKQIQEVRDARIKTIAKRIEGVKRSTGQHPGGIVVVPQNKDIFDITPIQYPADDTTSEWMTTHFDYRSFEDNLLKLDILGHDDPTMIKFLMDYVHAHQDEFDFDKAQDIPLDDKAVFELFSSTQSIGLTEDELESEVASFGIPELGTPFVRQMLVETKPSNYAGLVKISGLSHGTDVWRSNSQDLVLGATDYGKIDFDAVIGCRDDIMVDLMKFGLSPLKSFEIMEFVRRGNPSKNKSKWNEYVAEMQRNNVPAWYIWSCGQIKYMFPKAHAAAYVLMAVRIAWFKIHKPLLFYSAFFSKRAVQFDHDIMVAGANAVRNKIKQIEKVPPFQQSTKDIDLLVTLNVAFEMIQRGYKFLPVDIHQSEARDFKMENNALRMPFMSIDGLGASVAFEIVEARNEKKFTSKDDIKERTRINKTVFEIMDNNGAFSELEEESDVFELGLFAL